MLELVDLCRGVHELFATSVSAWLAPGDPIDLVRPYGEYEQYVLAGDRIAPGWARGSMAKVLAVESVARVCMQSAALSWAAETTELAALTPHDMPHAMRPDARLTALDRLIDGTRWATLETSCLVVAGEHGAELLRPLTQAQPDLAPAHAESAAKLGDALRGELAAILEDHGMPTMSSEATMACARRLLGQLRTDQPWGQPWQTDSSAYQRQSLTNRVDGERLVIHRRRCVARVHEAPSELPLAPDGDGGRLALVVRPLARVLDQHALAAGDQHTLAGAATDGLIVALRGSRDRGQTFDYWPIGSPSIIRAWFATSVPRRVRVSAIISASALTQRAWRRQWLSALERADELTALVDIPPDRLLNGLGRNGAVTWESFTVQTADDRRGAVFVWHFSEFPKMPFVVIASGFALAAVEKASVQRWPEFAREQDPDQSIDPRLGFVAQLLMNEEPYFDFQGGVDIRRT